VSDPQSREMIERRSDEAFAVSGWQDPRAEYRALLRRLKEQAPAAFDSAVHEYEARVASRLGDESVEPVGAWLDYGVRLAELLGGGRTVAVDADGRSAPVDGSPAEPTLLLHLPADDTAAALVVAGPREPSAAQHATIALLAERRQALPA
jgi:hypothetical protein